MSALARTMLGSDPRAEEKWPPFESQSNGTAHILMYTHIHTHAHHRDHELITTQNIQLEEEKASYKGGVKESRRGAGISGGRQEE